MIQRKQSLFLLAIFIISIIEFFVPFIYWKLTWCGNSIFNPLQLYKSFNNDYYFYFQYLYIPTVLNSISTTISLISIFLYVNRKLQIKLSYLLALINICLVGSFLFISYVKSDIPNQTEMAFGTFLPIISAIFAFLAAHYIKKDELLVRSADRIR